MRRPLNGLIASQDYGMVDEELGCPDWAHRHSEPAKDECRKDGTLVSRTPSAGWLQPVETAGTLFEDDNILQFRT